MREGCNVHEVDSGDSETHVHMNVFTTTCEVPDAFQQPQVNADGLAGLTVSLNASGG